MDQNLSYNNEADDQAKPATPMPKRTMALHVAYVGSSFKGSAVNRVLGEDATVELVLEGVAFCTCSAMQSLSFLS